MTDFVLIIGSGAREHALAWKLAQSPTVKHVYVSPGNAGTHTHGKFSNCDVDVTDHEEIVLWCRSKNINLVVVGPEDPLAKGLADHLKTAGIKCFGPCKKAAQIEASKEFAKYFMDKYDIPTAKWKSFKDPKDAQNHISSAPYNALVVKASGLAAGKGVIVGKTKEDAINAVETLKKDKSLSVASDILVIEELLTGEEVSVLCFSDGTNISVMPPAQDHKRLLNNDEGPNTGGMGAYCRCPLVSESDMAYIKTNILQKAIDGMQKENSPYIGVLYAGLMLTKDGPKVLEFNCRFGDPETQVILPLLDSDLYSIMLACVEGKLNDSEVKWKQNKQAVGVVVVSGGYPGSYEKGKPIKGLEKVVQDCYTVFHAGTCHKSGALLTSGGRVLTVVALCDSLKDAAAEAQLGAAMVHFDGAFFRSDIAKKGLQKLPPKGMTYKASGVDIDSADDLVRKIKDLTKQTLRPEVCGGIGGFGGVFELSGYKDPLLISKVGSVGEKLTLAQELHSYEFIGSDLVANAVNSLLCHGAEPLFFLDTFTCGKLNVEIAAQVITGIARSCKEAKCALIGGETAEMPGMYVGDDFDLTSFARGAVEKSSVLPLTTVRQGDAVIALTGNSLNSDAIGIVRRLASKLDLDLTGISPFDGSTTLASALLAPRPIHVDTLLPLMRMGHVKAAAYIDKEGLSHYAKGVMPEGHAVVLDAGKWTIPPVHGWVARSASLTKRDMLNDFNLGLDMLVVVDVSHVESVLSHVASCGKKACVVGEVKEISRGQEIIDINTFSESQAAICRKRVAILTSDKGTSMRSLIEYSKHPSNLSAFEIAVVMSSSNSNEIATIAQQHQITHKILNLSQLKTSQEKDAALTQSLSVFKAEIICLVNFAEELPGEFLDAWRGRVLNMHPSILPAFEGSDVHQQVLEMGARITGCTVHFLDKEGLQGNILRQSAVSVDVSDSVDSLHKKVSELQQSLYPQTLEAVASGKMNHKHSSSQVSSRSSPKVLKDVDESVRVLLRSTSRPGFEMGADTSCGVFDLKAAGYKKPLLISGTDGVGTKLKIAQACSKHDTIGIDLVAMCVNDILTHGAEPLFFLEAFQCGKVNPETLLSVVSGIAEGCRQANCALIGAEVNEVPEIYLNPKQCLQEFDKYDVVGYAEGALQKENLLPRTDLIKPGDVLVGLPSSGVHSNGYSLVRKLVQVKNLRYQDPFPLDTSKTLQDVLLEPTKIYVRPVLPLMRAGLVKAAAHITGGGLTQNIPRVLPPAARVVLDGRAWALPPALRWVAAEGGLSQAEMLQTFNCGLGMVLVVGREHEAEVLRRLRAAGEDAATVGRVEEHVGGVQEQVEVTNFKMPILTDQRKKRKVGVLISGSGTNLQALIDYTQNPNNCSSAEIVLVLSNVPGVEGLNRASRAGIPTRVLSHKEFKKRVDFDMAVHEILKQNGVEIVCLAGFMRIVSKEFVQLWQGNLLNVHPALLPAFKGMNAHKLVLEMGAKISGCTVHFVEAEVDAGAIIQQACVQVDSDDDEKSLQEKVKVLEHQIFPTALELLASGRISRNSDGKLKWNF